MCAHRNQISSLIISFKSDEYKYTRDAVHNLIIPTVYGRASSNTVYRIAHNFVGVKLW